MVRKVVDAKGLSTTERLAIVTEAFQYMDDVGQLEFQVIMDVWKDRGITGMQVAAEIFEDIDLQDVEEFDPETFLHLLEQRLLVRNSDPLELNSPTN